MVRFKVLLMADEIRLGGNIVLNGFEELSSAEAVVAKKIIGGYARKFSDNIEGYKEMEVNLEKDDSFKLKSIVVSESNSFEAEAKDSNAFVALGKALNKLEEKAL